VQEGSLNLTSTNLPRPWSPWESSPSRKIPTVEPGIEPETSWLVVRVTANNFASSPYVNKAFRYTYSVVYLNGAVLLNAQSFSRLKPAAHLRYFC